MKRRSLLIAGLAAPAFFNSMARAQGISSRPVRFVLGQTPATTPDLIARTLAPRMQAKWGQPFLVENRGGAGGAIGLDAVAKSPPDGHVITISVNSTAHAADLLQDRLRHPEQLHADLDGGGEHLRAVVHPSVPAKNFAEFSSGRSAKAEGELRLARQRHAPPPVHGVGEAAHRARDHAHSLQGLGARVHRPDGGARSRPCSCRSAPRITLGARARSARSPAPARSARRSRRTCRRCTSRASRTSTTTSWFSAWGPAGMAPDLVSRYNAAFREILGEKEVRDTLAKMGVTVRLSTPAGARPAQPRRLRRSRQARQGREDQGRLNYWNDRFSTHNGHSERRDAAAHTN